MIFMNFQEFHIKCIFRVGIIHFPSVLNGIPGAKSQNLLDFMFSIGFIKFHENVARGTFKFVRQAVERNRRGAAGSSTFQLSDLLQLFGRKRCPRATNIHFPNRFQWYF